MGRNALPVAGLRSAVFAAALLGATAAAALEPWDRTPAFIDKRSPAALSSGGGAAAADLAARARLNGRIKVIVELDLAMPSDEATAPTAAAREQAMLREVQDAVLAAVLGRRMPTAGGGGVTTDDDGVRRYETIPFLSMVVTAAQLSRLLADDRVLTVQEDVPVPPTLLDSVPLVQAARLHALGVLGRRYGVAVLDTGVDLDHPMFGKRIKAEACFSSKVAGQSKSLCPGGAASSTDAGSGRNCPVSVAGCDHGTHVTSIAAGLGDGRRGVAPKGWVIAVQVFSRFDDPGDCGSSPAPCVLSFTSDQVAALEHVYRLRRTRFNMAAVNMSLGGGQHATHCDDETPAFTRIVQKLRRAQTATVIAAGNNGFDGSISSPACVSAAFAVGSTTKEDAISSFSNHSELVDVLAPGSLITAAVPGGLGTKSGTSMAAPHVAGAFALLAEAQHALDVRAVERALKRTGKPLARAGIAKPRIRLNDARKALLAETAGR
jgi:subtilisin family serine protease